MNRREILMASIICHLAEHIETGEVVDLQAAQSLMMQGDVYELFQEFREAALLPSPRKPVTMLERMYDA